MDKLFVGLLFVWLDMTVGVGSMKINILPDFLGYIFMVQGLETLMDKSAYFRKARPAAMVMVCYSLVIAITELVGLENSEPLISWILVLVNAVLGVLLLMWIVQGVRELEARMNVQLEGARLWTLWKVMAVVQVICALLYWIPILSGLLAISLLILGICFLAAFYGSKKRYHEATENA